jgi:hypothetical protein
MVKAIRVKSDLSADILKARKAWNDIFKTLKVNNCHEMTY